MAGGSDCCQSSQEGRGGNKVSLGAELALPGVALGAQESPD